MIQTLAPIVASVLDKFVEDKNLKQKIQYELETQLHTANLAQVEVNKAEAMSGNWFASSWRPAIGHSCALGFFYTFIGHPFLSWIMVLNGVQAELPTVNTEILLELTLAMLGLAGLRSFEKMRNVAR